MTMASFDQIAARINVKLTRRAYDLGEVRSLMTAAAEVTREEMRADPLVASGPELLTDLQALSYLCEVMNSRQHAGLDNGPAQWSMLYDLTNKAKATVSAATGKE